MLNRKYTEQNKNWKHFKLSAKHDFSKHLNTQPRSYLLMHDNSKIHISSNTKNNLWVGATGHTTEMYGKSKMMIRFETTLRSM